MRMTDEQRSQVERAAAMQGKTLTQWALDHLLEAARFDIEQETTTRLSADAFDELARALEKPMPLETRRLLDEKPVWDQ